MACGQTVNITALGNDVVHGFIQPPNVRGTTQIVYSCLLTIIACIYTSIHLNVPAPGEAASRQMIRRIKWTFIGVIAPEIVLYSAWIQYQQANELIIKMCKVAPELVYMNPKWHQRLRARLSSRLRSKIQPENASVETQVELCKIDTTHQALNATADIIDETGTAVRPGATPTPSMNSSSKVENKTTVSSSNIVPEERRLIDLTYGFYVVMGGISVDTSRLHDEVKTMVPSFKMLISMFDQEDESCNGAYLVSKLLVDGSMIRDRSKADHIAKILVCCQVFGMAVQCIARKVSNLPLTLLEIHTFAHVICAILLYMIWLEKPLNINDATVISLPDSYLGGFASQVAVFRPCSWYFEVNNDSSSRSSGQVIRLDENCLTSLHHDSENRRFYLDRQEIEYVETSRQGHERKQQRAYGDILDDNGLVCVKRFHRSSSGRWERFKLRLPLDRKGQRRWKLWYQHGQSSSASLRQPNYFDTYQGIIGRDPIKGFSGTVIDRGGGLAHLLEMMVSGWSSGIGAFLVLSLYAAIHLAAWNNYFPTSLEMWLWRASGLLILTIAPLSFLALFLPTLWIRSSESANWIRFKTRLGKKMVRAIEIIGFISQITFLLFLLLIFPTLLVGSLVARLVLVVEPFASLRVVPAGVYLTVPWSQYLPHL